MKFYSFREAARWASVHVAILAGLFGAMPEAWQMALLDLLHVPQSRVPAAFAILFILARMLKQSPSPEAAAVLNDDGVGKP